MKLVENCSDSVSILKTEMGSKMELKENILSYGQSIFCGIVFPSIHS